MNAAGARVPCVGIAIIKTLGVLRQLATPR
jgi:hypothetical protein